MTLNKLLSPYLGHLLPTMPPTTWPEWEPSLILMWLSVPGRGSFTNCTTSLMSSAMSMISSAWFLVRSGAPATPTKQSLRSKRRFYVINTGTTLHK